MQLVNCFTSVYQKSLKLGEKQIPHFVIKFTLLERFSGVNKKNLGMYLHVGAKYNKFWVD